MNRMEWVMHVWGKKRDTLELTDVEKFHIDMLKMFQDQHKRFDRIIVNFAMDDIQDLNLYHFLKSKIQKVIKNKNVEFWACQNDKDKGEYITFRPYVPLSHTSLLLPLLRSHRYCKSTGRARKKSYLREQETGSLIENATRVLSKVTDTWIHLA